MVYYVSLIDLKTLNGINEYELDGKKAAFQVIIYNENVALLSGL